MLDVMRFRRGFYEPSKRETVCILGMLIGGVGGEQKLEARPRSLQPHALGRSWIHDVIILITHMSGGLGLWYKRSSKVWLKLM